MFHNQTVDIDILEENIRIFVQLPVLYYYISAYLKILQSNVIKLMKISFVFIKPNNEINKLKDVVKL